MMADRPILVNDLQCTFIGVEKHLVIGQFGFSLVFFPPFFFICHCLGSTFAETDRTGA